MLFVKKLNYEDADKEWTFFQEVPSENGFSHEYMNISFELFLKTSIPDRLKKEKGIGLMEGYVPDTYFFLWLDDVIIGLYKVRHHANERLKSTSGHIGYIIHPQYRHLGYGTKGLALVLLEAKKIISDDVCLMSCLKSNIASLKIQLANGAILYRSDDEHYYTALNLK